MGGPTRANASWQPGRDAHAERHLGHRGALQLPDGETRRVTVVGGGIAGITAAVALAERGVDVTLLEACDELGGRVRSWPIALPDGSTGTMSRGFHAFFRQYYNLRALLRRVDPDLGGLRAVDDYPLRHADGTRDSFTRIANNPPWNFLSFVLRSPSFDLRDLSRVDADRALDLLDVDFPATYSRYDGVSAQEALDALRFPPRMRSLALEVFARSFFADPREFSAGELVAMFHMYFLGSGEGLLFDVSRDDFDTTFWHPLGRHLARLGARVETGARVSSIECGSAGWRVHTEHGPSIEADAVVIATTRNALQDIVARSSNLGDDTWRSAVSAAPMAPRFVVQRLWFDSSTAPSSAPFVGTAAFGHLDNVSLVHELEEGARAWAAEHGGSVVELHAYAVPDSVSDDDVFADLRAQLRRVHPELNDARVVHEERLVEADCPLAGTDEWAARPGVLTPEPGVVLAGDGVRCDLPVALMERAATTGFQAADALLARWGLAGHDLWSVPTQARFPRTIAAGRRALHLRRIASRTP